MSGRVLLLASTALVACSCTGFREGAPGAFRSPFAREEQLIRRIERHDIRTVVCLRGGRTARLSERATLATDAEFVMVPISAKRAPHPDALRALWRVASEAERPLLVHCRAGVDRTGLAMALVVLHDTGDLAKAREQLAFVPYGHIAAFGTEAMDQVLDRYEPYADRMTFPRWVDEVYAAEWANAEAPR